MATIQYEINGAHLGDPALSEEDKVSLTNAKNLLEKRLSAEDKERIRAYIGSFTINFGTGSGPQVFRSKSIFKFQEDAGLHLEDTLRNKISELRL